MSYLAALCESLIHAADIETAVRKLGDDDLRAVIRYWETHHHCEPEGVPGWTLGALILEAAERFLNQPPANK